MINKRRMSLFTNLTNVYVKKYGKEKDDIEEVIVIIFNLEKIE